MSPGIPALIKSNRTSSQDMVCCGLGSLTKGTFTAGKHHRLPKSKLLLPPVTSTYVATQSGVCIVLLASQPVFCHLVGIKIIMTKDKYRLAGEAGKPTPLIFQRSCAWLHRQLPNLA